MLNADFFQALREAKEEAEEKAKLEEEFLESRKCHYGAQFDDFQGTICSASYCNLIIVNILRELFVSKNLFYV